jgi:hypothetical protein
MVKTRSKKINYLSPAKKAWITRKIKSGKSKYQTAQELNLRKDTVYTYAKNLPSKPCGWPGIRGGTLKLLQELLTKGYAIHSCSNLKQRYQILRKYFPKVCKVKMYGRNIFFIEDKKDVAARAFLENINKKIISYQELKQVTKVFNTNLSKTEKQTFLGRFKSKKSSKMQGSKDNSLLKNDDSLAFFYIRNYCRIILTNMLYRCTY